MADASPPMSPQPVSYWADGCRYALAALAGCAVVFGMVVLALFPLAGVPSDFQWFRSTGLFLPFPLLAVPVLILIRSRKLRALWPYAVAAGLIAAGMDLVLNIRTLSQWHEDLLFGATRYGLLGSIAGLVFWSLTRPALDSTNAVSSSAGFRPGSWFRRLGMALYLIYVSFLLVVTLYGAGKELFGWPDVFGLYLKVD
jgi:hypothetical protein